MRKKMPRQALVDLFPEPLPVETDKDVDSTATSKGHKHVHKPSAKPSAGYMTPAEYRRRHKGRKHA